MKNIIIIIGMITFLTSCEKETDQLEISGYTHTNEDGVIDENNIDKDDWGLDDVWDQKIHDIFDTITFESIYLQSFSNYSRNKDVGKGLKKSVYPAYPNPSSTNTRLQIFYPDSCEVKLAFVNSRLEVYHTISFKFHNTITIEYALNKFLPNGLHRLYYKIQTPNEVLYGHGDILKTNYN